MYLLCEDVQWTRLSLAHLLQICQRGFSSISSLEVVSVVEWREGLCPLQGVLPPLFCSSKACLGACDRKVKWGSRLFLLCHHSWCTWPSVFLACHPQLLCYHHCHQMVDVSDDVRPVLAPSEAGNLADLCLSPPAPNLFFDAL